jgi:PAS domain S-box-containing protein
LDEDVIEVPVPVSAGAETEEITVLHVDDEPSMNDLTATYLERIDGDLAVSTATNAVEALDRLEREDVDCVVSDYDMPTTNGIEFLEIVREQYADLPFILFTGKGSEEVASEAIAAGVTDYMQKGTGTDQYEVLANRVRNVVERYRARQQFWEALSWYRRLVEQDLTGVFIVQDGEFVYVNERLADIFGYEQCDLVGESPLALAADEAAEATLETFLGVGPEDHDSFECEFTGECAESGELDVEVHGGSINYRGELGCIGILWSHDGGT